MSDSFFFERSHQLIEGTDKLSYPLVFQFLRYRIQVNSNQ